MNLGVVFDLDGTLIDSAADIQTIANNQLRRFKANPLSLYETREFIGNGIDAFIERMCKARDISTTEHDTILKGFVASYDTAVSRTKPYPAVEEALQYLYAKSIKLGICTNKPVVPARSVLRHLSLERYFSVIVGGDNLSLRKPNPEILVKVFDDLKVDNRIFVGDSEIDSETAERAGVPFILFAGGYRKSALDDITFSHQFQDYSNFVSLVSEITTNM